MPVGETVGTPEVSMVTIPLAPPLLEETVIVHVPAGCTLSAVTVNVPDGPFAVVADALPATLTTLVQPEDSVAVKTVPAVAIDCVTVTTCGAPEPTEVNVNVVDEAPLTFTPVDVGELLRL
jgi:hypothetical protein